MISRKNNFDLIRLFAAFHILDSLKISKEKKELLYEFGYL
tara:strand:+ start:266 stop:385 length:120 start_codon:yes stop_codon:yes gene_type:complete